MLDASPHAATTCQPAGPFLNLPSSNRACGFPAHGFPMFFTARHTLSSNPLSSALCTGRTSRTMTCLEKLVIPHIPVTDLVPLPQMRYHLFFQMVTYAVQRLAAITVVKISDPTPHVGVDFIHYPFKGHDCPLAFRQLGYPVLDLLTGFLRRLHMGIISSRFPSFAHPDRKSEKAKLSIKRVDDLSPPAKPGVYLREITPAEWFLRQSRTSRVAQGNHPLRLSQNRT